MGYVTAKLYNQMNMVDGIDCFITNVQIVYKLKHTKKFYCFCYDVINSRPYDWNELLKNENFSSIDACVVMGDIRFDHSRHGRRPGSCGSLTSTDLPYMESLQLSYLLLHLSSSCQ